MFDISTASTPKDLQSLQDDDSIQQAPKRSTRIGKPKIPSESMAPPSLKIPATTMASKPICDTSLFSSLVYSS
jgi:hypothetical protein